MARLDKPDSSERDRHGTSTERLPGGRVVIRHPNGRVIDAPEGSPVTTWPNDKRQVPRPGK